MLVVFVSYITLSDLVSEIELSFKEDSNTVRDFDLAGSSLISTYS